MKYISNQKHQHNRAKMSRMGKALLACLALPLLLATACTDDGIAPDLPDYDYQDGDPVSLTFTVSVPAAEEVAVSRALGESQENTLNELALLVFDTTQDDATLQQGPYFIGGDDLQDVTDQADGLTRKRFTVQMEAATQTQAIYLVANVNARLRGLNLLAQTTTLSHVRALTENASDATAFSMSGLKQLPIPHADLLTQDFPLSRNAAKLTVDVASADPRFALTGFALYCMNTEGSILAGADATQPGYTLPEPLEPEADPALTLAGEPLYTYPCRNQWGDGTNTPKENTRTFLLIEGTYTAMEGCPAQTCYWHADLADAEGNPVSLQANHHYAIGLTGDVRPGYADKAAAIKGAENIHITIVDTDLNSRNMASDGLIEISAEADTLRIDDNSVSSCSLRVTVKTKENTQPGNLVCELLGNHDWVEGVNSASAGWTQMERTPVSGDNGNHLPANAYYWQQVVTLSRNESFAFVSDRYEALLKLTCQGVSIYVVVVYEPGFSAHHLFDSKDVELRVRNYERNDQGVVSGSSWVGGGEGTRYSYWEFIQGDPDDSGNPPLYGIKPEDMGGKVRTEGFHAPMSDFQQFVYTVHMPQKEGVTSWKVELDDNYKDKLRFWHGSRTSPDGGGTTTPPSGGALDGTPQVFTFTNELLEINSNGAIVEDAYRCGENAFRIVLTYADGHTETYAYDLYHTGVFNYEDWESASGYYLGGAGHPCGWYYYEVILMGRNYWLDRNLGARSAGYSIKGSNLGTTWPYADGLSAGGWYQIANIPTTDGNLNLISGDDLEQIAPRGFRVPYVSEFQAMTADSRFRMDYVHGGTGGSHWEAAYHTGKADQGSVYFPLAGMWYNGSEAGNQGTGYYWTQTEALGASGTERGYWLQYMQLAASSASTGRYRIFPKGQSQPTGMSVRCVYDSRVVEELITYKCYVQGYTHVFLYAEDSSTGKRTYLTPWPGQMININDAAALELYKTFSYETMTDYEALGQKLKVVFVLADNDGNVQSTYPENYSTNGGLYFLNGGKFPGSSWQE